MSGTTVELSHLDKVLFPEQHITKGELIEHYRSVAARMLPHLHDRPLTLKRYPNGVDAPYFYERQSPAHRPEWVETVRVGDVEYTLAQDRPTLVWLANLAAIESRVAADVAAGHLPEDADPRALARFSGAVFQGMSQQARDGAGRWERCTR